MIRYGKSSDAWFESKSWFFDQNEELLAECLRLAEFYARQPRRDACVNCRESLPESPDFVKHDVPYFFCSRCGHLNGGHLDTEEFVRGLYDEEESDLFSKMYDAESREAFIRRRDAIYRPKADFLLEALREQGLSPDELRFADLGAGSGYFVAALMEAGIDGLRGYEVSDNQVRLANAMIGEEVVLRHDQAELEELAESLEAEVVSLVFVLEHVRDPESLLAALSRNPHVRFLFVAVPLFSPCVFLEMAFPEIAHRHLTCGHTHLYTRSSLDWLCRHHGLDRNAEWWFGADAIDLFRMVALRLGESPETAGMVDRWEEMIRPMIDDLQLVFDRRETSSEIHFLAEVQR